MEKSNTVLVRRSPNGIIETQRVEPKIIEDLRAIGFGLSRKEMELLRRKNALEAERRLRTRDPPCVCCGTWSDDWLCPNCRVQFPWMHPQPRRSLKCLKNTTFTH